MRTFEVGKTYKLTRHKRSVRAEENKVLTYIGKFPAVAHGGLDVFRSHAADWRETFTQQQLEDYSIGAAS